MTPCLASLGTEWLSDSPAEYLEVAVDARLQISQEGSLLSN